MLLLSFLLDPADTPSAPLLSLNFKFWHLDNSLHSSFSRPCSGARHNEDSNPKSDVVGWCYHCVTRHIFFTVLKGTCSPAGVVRRVASGRLRYTQYSVTLLTQWVLKPLDRSLNLHDPSHLSHFPTFTFPAHKGCKRDDMSGTPSGCSSHSGESGATCHDSS